MNNTTSSAPSIMSAEITQETKLAMTRLLDERERFVGAIVQQTEEQLSEGGLSLELRDILRSLIVEVAGGGFDAGVKVACGLSLTGDNSKG